MEPRNRVDGRILQLRQLGTAPELEGLAMIRATRRSLCQFAGVVLLGGPRLIGATHAQPTSSPVTLLSAPLELIGEWGGSPPQAAFRVLARMREVSLAGIELISDQQPEKLRIDEHSSGPPAIWLHKDPPQTAWIIVDTGPLDWCKLSYQFGHELGHVLCNSWSQNAQPRPPTQWLEEALVEAFSIRGLGLLATSWERTPPFAGDAGFAAPIRQYRDNIVENYRKQLIPSTDFASWFGANRAALEGGLATPEGSAVLAVLPELERDKACVEDLGAANRWPERTGVPVEKYLSLWEKSCGELGVSGRLPVRLRTLLKLG
jgi:hypothetical protein